jgi:diguanylate cyclase (GGDEF)-like protein/PAS domain S-box-containing protein
MKSIDRGASVTEHGAQDDWSAQVLEAWPDAAVLLDDDGRILWGNVAATELFGVSFDDGLGRDALDFVHPDDLQMALLSLESMQDKQLGTLLELRMRRADGTWRLMEMRGARHPDGLLVSVRDLTERRRWEIAGGESARLRALLQNSTTLMMVLDADGTVASSSGSLSRLLARGQEWLEGRNMDALVDERDHDQLRATLEVVRCGAVPVTLDLRLVNADGRPVPFAVTLTNLLEDPTVGGIVATGHDVSDRVRAEQELRAANSLLAATLESTADGILVVDLDGRVVSYNARFAEMWRLPDQAISRSDDHHIIEAIQRQLRDPASFVAKIRELYAAPESASRDVLEFLDGRVFERDSLPQRIDGEVVGRVWSFRDMTEQSRLQDELSHQAFHDPLTGLANQALFRDRLEMAMARLARHGGELALLFIDLDDFKHVNDNLGHGVGDALLASVGERLTASLRPGDTAARLGGDEFAVLVDEVMDPHDAPMVAERIIEVLAQPVAVAGATVSVSASIGVAYGVATDQVEDLLRNADLAMYTAKSAGKRRVEVFADEMHEAAAQRLDVEARLRGAADRGELVLHYQPIVELASGRITAMEALVRWQHPERGLLGPLSFIPFAEEGGLIDEIGHHVMVTACEDACRWARDVGPLDAPAVSVNLSPRQLQDPDLIDRVELLLHRSGLHPAQLVLEITEGALMRDPVAATSGLEQLSRLGVRLAVDDFGTGYSSLSYLQQFPIDILKIDGAFVADDMASSGWSLAQAIIHISHALGLVPIAEGVETQAQADALVELGCSLAQGYHLGRPVDAATARRMIAERAALPPVTTGLELT